MDKTKIILHFLQKFSKYLTEILSYAIITA